MIGQLAAMRARAFPAGRVVVTGSAWAVPRGIRRVEVGVQDGGAAGSWVTAELAPDGYTLVCRATDGDGVVQTAERRSPLPGAATGRPTRTVTVT